MADSRLMADLNARGLVSQTTGNGELEEHLQGGSRTVYCGFDPTAGSLHIGHLVPLLALRRFQQAGHRPVALVGGATGLIGDPSFKDQERTLNAPDVVRGWVDALQGQIGRLLDTGGEQSVEVVNNLEWMEGMGALDFLRDIGKHFSVSSMIQKESVRQRLEREGAGISFTEFSYMLLQSYDFAELYRRYGCTVQLGGSDQWGNITGGIDLTRRMHGAQVHGMTMPLVTKADGTKFGKTESGTVWLDPALTSPYAFYQFWIRTADADVYKFLRYFTFLDTDEITAIEVADRAADGRPQAQGVLARELTRLIHGEGGLEAAERISQALFSGETAHLDADDYRQLKLDGLPCTVLRRSDLSARPLTQLLSEAGLASSGKQVKDALARQAVLINGLAVGMEQNTEVPACFAAEAARHGCYYLVRLGRRRWHLFEVR